MTPFSELRLLTRPTGGALVAAVALLVSLLAPPAHAEHVVLKDPKDAEFYDIATVHVKHRAKRVRVDIRDRDRTPYGFHVLVDVPGGKRWDYIVLWAVYTPRKVYVQTRKQWGTDRYKCTVKSAHETLKTVDFSVPTRCFKKPGRLRVKVKGWDDEAGFTDHTRWSRWAERA